MIGPKRLTIILLTLVCFIFPWAANAFTVKRIEILGLHRISRGTVLSYLPVTTGEDLSPEQTSDIIQSLYKTGFFSDISLARDGNNLIIKVVERPIIGAINFSGNKKIKKKKLLEVLKDAGIQQGLVFDHSSLQMVKQVLLQQYYNLGRYDAKVMTSVHQQSRNRVGINIKIYEGQVVKIAQIILIGNHAFDTSVLLNQFKLTPPNLLSWITHNDQYSRQKLNADLERLRSYYLDRGYLEFQINSTQVSITPDKKHIYITIHITEGPVYHIANIKLAGKLLGKKKQLMQLIQLRSGQIFSRKAIVDSSDKISQFFANQGYAFASVDAHPSVNKKTRQVSLTFAINPKKRVYINRITFNGNMKTADYVLRREMRLMEGSPFSWNSIKESKRRLALLGYLKDIQVKTTPVPGTKNKVDLNYKVKEQGSATASLSAGYSDIYGFIYGANIKESNFMGTGKQVNVGFNRSQYSQQYGYSYTNPYYTVNGVSRGYSIYYERYTPGEVNLVSYTSEVFGANLNYGIPLSEDLTFALGAGYEHRHIGLASDSGQTVTSFVNHYGTRYDNTKANFSLTYNNYDRAIFPTRGFAQEIDGELGLPILSRSVDYYKISYLASFYYPLLKGFILHPHANLGYGNGYGRIGELPFFENFYAGGIGTVRGYEGNTLGPDDTKTGDPVGGSVLVAGSFELIFPNPLTKQLRTSIFVDAGNVYENQLKLQRLRYSVGLQATWYSPFGPLQFSLAKALNPGATDDPRVFQFTIGTSL